MEVVYAYLALAAVFVFPPTLASMMKKVLKEESVAKECVLLFFCGLSAWLCLISF